MFMLKGKYGILNMRDGSPFTYSNERLSRIGKRVMENHLNKDREKGKPKKRLKIVPIFSPYQVTD